MKNLKLMLLSFILFVFCIKTSYGEIVRISEMVSGPINYDVVKEVCEHTYSNKEIQVLEKIANRGNSLAQLKLGILYDIRSMQRYQQVLENQSMGSSVSTNDKRITRVLTKQKLSPCIHIKNTDNLMPK